MQFQKGQSGNPAGRPRGSFSPTAMLAEQMLTGDAEGIIRKTIDKAKDGNGAALRICWERIAPLPKKEPVGCDLPPLLEVSDAASFVAALITAVACGDLVAREGSEIAKLADTYLRTVETTDFEVRLIKLEQAYDRDGHNQRA